MSYMGTAGNRGGGWPERVRRIAAVTKSPHAPAVAGALLGLAAMTEAIARGASTGMRGASLVGVCARRQHHGAAGLSRAGRGRRRYLCDSRTVPRGLPD